ncbi:MAG: lipoate--protein ligase family protein, partial [Chloroflexota bacterium]
MAVHQRDSAGSVERCYAAWLRPAVETYRAFGVPAEISSVNDISVQGRKLSGTGMAQIEDAIVLVGNILLDFDYATMARVLKAPDEAFRSEVEARMRENVSSLAGELGRAVPRQAVESELIRQFGLALGVELVPGSFSPAEDALLRETDAWFLARRSRQGRTAAGPPVRRVKIRGGVHVLAAASSRDRRARLHAIVCAREGHIDSVLFRGRSGDRVPALRPLEEVLAGCSLSPDAIDRAIAARVGRIDPRIAASARTCLLRAAAQRLD